MTSGVRKLTFSRAVVPLEIRFVLTIKDGRSARRICLLEKRPARFLESRRRDHQARTWIGRFRIIDALHFRSKCRIFRLRTGDVHRRANFYKREKFWGGFAMQTNTAMRARGRVDKALVKPIRWCEFAPVSHRITDIASRSTPGRGDNAITL